MKILASLLVLTAALAANRFDLRALWARLERSSAHTMPEVFAPLLARPDADPTVTWIGPDCWRSTGDRWCYEYRLRPLGVLSTPVVTLLR